MRIYLIRHAHAVDGDRDLPDDLRWLNATGRRAATAVGAKLREASHTFDAVLTSPLVRAVQTAELVAAAVGYPGEVTATRALEPGVPPRAVVGELAAQGVAVAVVGHEPSIAMLAALLVQRPSFPPFRKGQVVLIEDGEARWVLTADALRMERLIIP